LAKNRSLRSPISSHTSPRAPRPSPTQGLSRRPPATHRRRRARGAAPHLGPKCRTPHWSAYWYADLL